MPPIDEPSSFAPKPPGEARHAKSRRPAPPPETPSTLLAFTVDPAAGRIVAVECVEPSGERHALSGDERAAALGTHGDGGLARLMERAFEAGIDCVLGGGMGEDAPESEDDAKLRGLILRSLIKRSALAPLMERANLSKALVGALIEQAPGPTH